MLNPLIPEDIKPEELARIHEYNISQLRGTYETPEGVVPEPRYVIQFGKSYATEQDYLNDFGPDAGQKPQTDAELDAQIAALQAKKARISATATNTSDANQDVYVRGLTTDTSNPSSNPDGTVADKNAKK